MLEFQAQPLLNFSDENVSEDALDKEAKFILEFAKSKMQ